MYSFANNPQYTLEVQAKSQAPVWILLTRHITNKVRHSTFFYFVCVFNVYVNLYTGKGNRSCVCNLLQSILSSADILHRHFSFSDLVFVSAVLA